MDDKLAASTAAFLDFVKEQAQAGTTFAKEQAPLVVQEYLRWEFWYGAGWCLLSAGLVVVSVVVIFAYWRYVKRIWKSLDDTGCNDPRQPLLAIGGSVLSIAVGVFACIMLYNAIDSGFQAGKVCIAPRVVVLEKLSKLVK